MIILRILYLVDILTGMAFLIPINTLLNKTICYSRNPYDHLTVLDTLQASILSHHSSAKIMLAQEIQHARYLYIAYLHCVYKPSILPLKNIQPLATEAETFVHTNIPWVTYLMKYYSVRRCEQSWSFIFASTLN